MAEETDPKPTRALAVRPQVTSIQPLFDTDHFEHMQRAANALMHSTLLKDSIRGPNPQACFSNLMLIFEQAQRFGLPATTVAQNVDVVFGQLVYRGVLIAAMVEQKIGKLYRHYTGDRGQDDYRVFIWDKDFAELSDEVLASLKPGKYPKGARMVDGSVGEWRTYQKDGKPNPAWVGRSTQPQLGYRGDREWCRFYEPAILLGVYGDEEIAAYAEITSVETIVDDEPISADFVTAPKGGSPAAASASGVDTAGSAGEGADASRQPQDGGKAPPRRRNADKVAAELDKKGAADEQARVDALAAGRHAGLSGEALESFSPTYFGDVLEHWKNGFAAGVAERESVGGDAPEELGAGDAEAEAAKAELDTVADGYAVGLAGKACQVPLGVAQELEGVWRSAWTRGDAERTTRQAAQLEAADPKKATAPDKLRPGDTGRSANQVAAYEAGHKAGLSGAEGTVQRAWTEFADDFSEGWNAGAAERLQDQTDNGDAEAEEEETDQPDVFDVFASQITGHPSWKDAKGAVTALSKTDEWKADLKDGGHRVASARISAGVRLQQLINSNAEPADLITHDLMAFRCWSEMTEDDELILSKYQELVLGPVWDGLESENQQAFERVIKARVATLRGK